MTTNPNVPGQNRDHRELRLVDLLRAMGMGLLATAAAVYPSLVHPSMTGPLGVGGAVLGALAGAGALLLARSGTVADAGNGRSRGYVLAGSTHRLRRRRDRLGRRGFVDHISDEADCLAK